MSAREEARRAELDPEDDEARLTALRAQARAGQWREALGPLWDRLAWSAAPKAAQDLAVESALRGLGPRWRLIQIAEYACGGARHRIATLGLALTPALELRLNLLPGGEVPLGAVARAWRRRWRVPPLLIGVTPLTRREWSALRPDEGDDPRPGGQPMTGVSWCQAQDWLAEAGQGLRLPSEVEWEHACRAGAASTWCFGDDPADLDAYAWTLRNTRGPLPEVGRLRPNAFGLLDVHGLVSEWCEDCWRDEPPESHEPTRSGASHLRVNRGGSAEDASLMSWCESRSADTAEDPAPDIGLRLARSLA